MRKNSKAECTEFDFVSLVHTGLESTILQLKLIESKMLREFIDKIEKSANSTNDTIT